MPGAAAGDFTVKACGKAHAWCRVCRPAQASAQRGAQRHAKTYASACRNCGRCDVCIGLNAPEGFKVCRRCECVKPLGEFAPRTDTGGRRNACNSCRNGEQTGLKCAGCNRSFYSTDSGRTLCAQCRPAMTKPCTRCGTAFVGTLKQRSYCSPACSQAAIAEQRLTARVLQRMDALRAYSPGEPSCSCCAETVLQFLALDHINGGGGAQRKKLGGGGFYAWLRRNGYPDGFRVLCHNCNIGRQLNGGVCPHKSKQPVTLATE